MFQRDTSETQSTTWHQWRSQDLGDART